MTVDYPHKEVFGRESLVSLLCQVDLREGLHPALLVPPSFRVALVDEPLALHPLLAETSLARNADRRREGHYFGLKFVEVEVFQALDEADRN